MLVKQASSHTAGKKSCSQDELWRPQLEQEFSEAQKLDETQKGNFKKYAELALKIGPIEVNFFQIKPVCFLFFTRKNDF